MRIKIIVATLSTVSIILFLILAFLFAKSNFKKQEIKKQDDFLTVYEYANNEKTSETVTDNNESYWWVLVEDTDQEMKRNTFIKQNHNYFSYAEAKQAFEKDCFILNFIRVDKETYENNSSE